MQEWKSKLGVVLASLSLILFLSSVMADEGDSREEISRCMVVGLIAYDTQVARQSTGDTLEKAQEEVRKLSNPGMELEMVLAIMGIVHNEYTINRPPDEVQGLMVDNCVYLTSPVKSKPRELSVSL